jgi:hypothetical protein
MQSFQQNCRKIEKRKSYELGSVRRWVISMKILDTREKDGRFDELEDMFMHGIYDFHIFYSVSR